jgi:hypothetical protein
MTVVSRVLKSFEARASESVVGIPQQHREQLPSMNFSLVVQDPLDLWIRSLVFFK